MVVEAHHQVELPSSRKDLLHQMVSSLLEEHSLEVEEVEVEEEAEEVEEEVEEVEVEVPGLESRLPENILCRLLMGRYTLTEKKNSK